MYIFYIFLDYLVDAFQGRQKDVILLSCVRATQMTDVTTTTIGFVANRQRLNVSLTRAKYAMYILGHMNSLNVSIYLFFGDRTNTVFRLNRSMKIGKNSIQMLLNEKRLFN